MSDSIGHLMMERAMHTNMSLPLKKTEKQDRKVSAAVRISGLVTRTLFILILTVMTARVASPQNETFSSVLETPGDFIRVLLGFAICVWFIVNLFILPKDDGAFRTWMYLGPAILPLVLLCVIWAW